MKTNLNKKDIEFICNCRKEFSKLLFESNIENSTNGQHIMRNIINGLEDVSVIKKHQNKFTKRLIRIRQKMYKYLGKEISDVFCWIPWYDDFIVYKENKKKYNIDGANSSIYYYLLHQYNKKFLVT